MRLSRRFIISMLTIIRKSTVLLLTGSLVANPIFAQEAHEVINFQNGRKAYPIPFNQYRPTNIGLPRLTNTPRIGQLIQNGKIMLSLSDAIALGLENNLDLAIARYNLPIADTEILRAKAGSGLRGVNTGLVQGTPGGAGPTGTGAQGGGAGGTTTGAGGAGTGTSGIVTSTSGAGPNVGQFDPSLTSTLQLEHGRTPQSTSFITGTNTLSQNSALANFAYNQGFSTGTSLSVSFSNSRSASNNLNASFNPALQSTFRTILSQRLLQGFGIQNQRRFIITARNNKRITNSSFRQQIISTVSQIQNLYWDLVNAYEAVKARQRAVTLAQQLSSDNRKQVDIGTLAPIEIVRADSQVAAANQDLIIAQTNLQLQQLQMKNALTRNLSDPMLVAAEVIPTDIMQVTDSDDATTSVQDLITRALAQRPDIEQSRIDLQNREITKRAVRSGLLPSVDLFGFYGGSAIAGNPVGRVPGTNLQVPNGPSTGYSDALSNLFSGIGPDKGAGLQLNIPILNRSAQADQIRSELEYQQAQMRLQQLENQIQIQVRNAQFTLQQNRARVEAATKGRELAQQSLDAESKKYQLGASTSYNVLQMQRDLATAESNLVSANSDYEKARVQLDQLTGNTLDRLGIEFADAVNAQVMKNLVVPNVVPNPNPGALKSDQQARPAQPQPPQTPK